MVNELELAILNALCWPKRAGKSALSSGMGVICTIHALLVYNERQTFQKRVSNYNAPPEDDLPADRPKGEAKQQKMGSKA